MTNYTTNVNDAIELMARFGYFDFNDQSSRNNFVNTLTSFLDQAVRSKFVQRYMIICDDTNNTEKVLNDNEFVGDIYLKYPDKPEFTHLSFVSTRTAVQYEEVRGSIENN
jgi:uncharacterized protein VirK/YbjX